MGFKCPICHKDFGHDKEAMSQCLGSHSEEVVGQGNPNLVRTNFNDLMANLVKSQIPNIKGVSNAIL